MYRLIVLSLMVILSSCKYQDQFDFQDPDLKLTRNDYKELLQKPELQPTPQPKAPLLDSTLPKIPAQFNQRISLNITQAIPLRDILMALSQQAKVNMVISPHIEGGATLFVKDRPSTLR